MLLFGTRNEALPLSGLVVSRATVPLVVEKPVCASVKLLFSNVAVLSRVPLTGVGVSVGPALVGVAVAGTLVAVGVAVGVFVAVGVAVEGMGKAVPPARAKRRGRIGGRVGKQRGVGALQPERRATTGKIEISGRRRKGSAVRVDRIIL